MTEKAKPEDLKTISRKIDDIIDAHPSILGDKAGKQKGAEAEVGDSLRKARDTVNKRYDNMREGRDKPKK